MEISVSRIRLWAVLAAVTTACQAVPDVASAAQECGTNIEYKTSAHDGFPAGKCAALPGGSKLFYYDTGWPRGRDKDPQRKVVIFTHAGSGNADAFKYQFLAFSAAGYRVISYDRLNVNRSSNAGATPAANLPTTVDDLAQLADRLGLYDFDLVGIAAGGGVALQFASALPDRVRNLVVAASNGPAGLPANFPALATFVSRIRIPFEVFCPANPIPANVIPPLRTIAATTTAIPEVTDEHRELGATFRGENPAGVAFYLEIVEHSRHATFDGCRETLIGTTQPGLATTNAANPNTPERLAGIRSRTLLISGGGDFFFSPPGHMRLWGSLIPDSQFAVMGEVGHAPQIEDPELFNSLVIKFLKGGNRHKHPRDRGHDDND